MYFNIEDIYVNTDMLLYPYVYIVRAFPTYIYSIYHTLQASRECVYSLHWYQRARQLIISPPILFILLSLSNTRSNIYTHFFYFVLVYFIFFFLENLYIANCFSKLTLSYRLFLRKLIFDYINFIFENLSLTISSFSSKQFYVIKRKEIHQI